MGGVIETINFTLLDETGPHNVLLFGCQVCQTKKLTSLQLESHMRNIHHASKFTVNTITAARNRNKKADV